MLYAHIESGVVTRLVPGIKEFTAAEQFAPAFAAELVDVSDLPTPPAVGATTPDGGKTWAAPAAPSGADTLAAERGAQLARLRTACGEAIVAGFNSPALGSPHLYPSDMAAQANMGTASQAGQGSLWCEAGGTWTWTPHTGDQLRALNADWVAFRQGLQERYAALSAQVAGALTVDAVRAVVWSAP